MLQAGNGLLIVSKPHRDVVSKMIVELKPYRSQVMFRFSLGSASSEILHLWEPGAPDFKERLESLRLAHGAGFQTSVSCEPMLDQHIDLVIAAVRPYVTDSVWIGKANRLRCNLAFNCPDDADVRQLANQLIEWQSDTAIMELYGRLQHDPMIKWKDSIKKVVGIAQPDEVGLDI